MNSKLITSSHIAIAVWLFCFTAFAQTEEVVAAAQVPGAKWGFIGTRGHFKIPPRWDYVSDFSEGFAVVANFIGRGPKGEEDMGGIGKFGFIDATGNLVIQTKYAYAEPFVDGLALVNIGGETPQARHQLVSFGKWAYINTKGEIVFELEKGTKGYSFKSGLARFDQHGKWGFRNISGQVSIESRFADATDFYGSKAFVKPDEKSGWHILDKRGSILGNLNAQEVSEFEGGKAVIKVNDRWGVCSSSGSFYPFSQSDKLWPLSEGMILGINSKYQVGYFDKNGKLVVPFKYGTDSRSFQEGLAAVSISASIPDTSKAQNQIGLHSLSVYGFIDKIGEMVIQQRFFGVRDFHHGKCGVQQTIGGMYGYINSKGQTLIAPRYVNVRDFHSISK